MTIKSGAKQTLAKKMKQWTAAEEEKAMMDLEIMYLQSNQNPKLYNMLTSEEKLRQSGQSSGSHQGKVIVGKYTRDDQYQFRLDTAKDMIPISWPDTMTLTPVIHALNKEHTDMQKIANQNPHTPFHEVQENYYKKKREDLIQSRKNMQKMSMRHTQETSQECVNDRVQRRMESNVLNSFMMQTEIQEIAERHEQF